MGKAGKPKIVEAEGFVLRDSHGFIRAEIGLNQRDVVGVKLCDGRGLRRAELVVTKDGTAGLQFFDEAGSPRLTLYLDQMESLVANPTVTLTGADGQATIRLPVKAQAGPGAPEGK
jgi:hypothetical protein